MLILRTTEGWEWMEKTIVLMDIDGTLLYTGGAGRRALHRAFQEVYGGGEVLEEIRMDGKTDPEIVREALQMMGRTSISPEEIHRILANYLRFLREEVWKSPNYRLLPGVREMLEDLATREEILLGLATGNIQAGAEIKLARVGINSYFRFGGYGSDSENRAEVIRIAIARAQHLFSLQRLRKDQVYVIGDTPRDIIYGRQASATTVAVATGRFTPRELGVYYPDYLLSDLTQYRSLPLCSTQKSKLINNASVSQRWL